MEQTYDMGLELALISPPSKARKIFIGCRKYDEPWFVVGVVADANILTRRTTSTKIATRHNGYYYYLYPGKSMGFSPTENIKLSSEGSYIFAPQRRYS